MRETPWNGSIWAREAAEQKKCLDFCVGFIFICGWYCHNAEVMQGVGYTWRLI